MRNFSICGLYDYGVDGDIAFPVPKNLSGDAKHCYDEMQKATRNYMSELRSISKRHDRCIDTLRIDVSIIEPVQIPDVIEVGLE